MSDTQSDNETSRRTLIAAVAAAGAAVPLMTAPAKAASDTDDDQRCGSTGLKPRPKFVVDLGDIDLEPDVAKMLGEQIRKTVLMTLARTGERRTRALPYEGPLPPYWYGFILNQADIHQMPGK